MRASLVGSRGVEIGIPPLGKFFDGTHIDGPVVEIVLDVGQILGEEAPIGADRVAAERHRTRLRNMRTNEVEGQSTGLFETGGRGPDGFEEARSSVHVDDEGIHGDESRFGRLDDQIGTFGHDFELVVSDDGRDLDDHFFLVIETCHLEIHPHQHVGNHRSSMWR